MRRKLLILIAASAAISAIVFAGIASAHSRPVRFEPSPGQVLQAAPSQVSGWFTGELRRDPNWTFLHVTDAQGNRVDAGEAQFSSDRLQMTVPLKPALGPGRYLVTWRSFDDGDGAIFGDCFVFYVGQAAADQGLKDSQRLDGGGSRECARVDFEAATARPGPTHTLVAGTATMRTKSTPTRPASSDETTAACRHGRLSLAAVAGLAAGGSRDEIRGQPWLEPAKVRWLLLALVLAAATFLAAGPQRPADAHALLVRADPPINAQLREPPTVLTLYFSEALERKFSSVRVLDQDGKRVDDRVEFDDADQALMRVYLKTLTPGYVTVELGERLRRGRAPDQRAPTR